MSILIIFLSSSNIASVTAFASSVLPTPVGPKNINEPIGLSTDLSPDLARITASVTASTASFCPITLLDKILSIFSILSLSVSTSLFTGIPVHLETTSAISSSSTSSFNIDLSFLIFSSSSFNLFSRLGSVPYFNLDNFSKSYFLSASSISLFTVSISSFTSFTLSMLSF